METRFLKFHLRKVRAAIAALQSPELDKAICHLSEAVDFILNEELKKIAEEKRQREIQASWSELDAEKAETLWHWEGSHQAMLDSVYWFNYDQAWQTYENEAALLKDLINAIDEQLEKWDECCAFIKATAEFRAYVEKYPQMAEYYLAIAKK